ncbi:helix-turn-helix domain-containing protein [Bifidobacterium callimiconis]|uniref:helix-turn-helix domain-containing protein n=1 Tax=Bifidobacterium callimiconis TaxID=2306973 RepID=UPI001BDCD575|nr:helix-turn-helix transcriptional regulator [Bifidobacterium callimiconis]MBT1176993.1 helix-turn-helix domain-containing protein [Bifidobacterium callimiconis]
MKMNEAVGDFLKRTRRAYGLTLDQIATASRRYGSDWTAANLSHLERGGSKADSLPNLLILIATLNHLTGKHMSLRDVFPQEVQLNPLVSTSAADIAGMLSGKPIALQTKQSDADTADWFDVIDSHIDQIVKDIPATSERNTLLAPAELRVPENAAIQLRKSALIALLKKHIPTESERKAASKLDMPTARFVAWCYVLYNRPLNEETMKRAGEDSTPQKRGRVTRTIIEEIRQAAAQADRDHD